MIIIISAYLAGIVFFVMKYKRDPIYGIEGIFDLIGYITAILIWPYWMVYGIIYSFKKKVNRE